MQHNDKQNQELPPDIMQRALQQIMRERGSVRSSNKAASSAENGRRGGRPARAVEEFACMCSATELEAGHKAICARGRAIKRRQTGK